MSSRRIAGLLFDKDGTLIDFDATWGPAAYHVMRALAGGDEAAFARLVAAAEYVLAERRFLPCSPLVAGSSAHYGPLFAQALRRPDGAELHAEIDRLFERFGLESLAPIGDPASLMAMLARSGLTLGIATNDSESSARAQASALGLAPHLGFVAGYDSGFGAKPGPGMVRAFLASTGLAPAEVALVGDSLHDLHAARAAGVVAIAVLTGPLGEAGRAELAPFADHVLGSIAELPGFLGLVAAA